MDTTLSRSLSTSGTDLSPSTSRLEPSSASSLASDSTPTLHRRSHSNIPSPSKHHSANQDNLPFLHRIPKQVRCLPFSFLFFSFSLVIYSFSSPCHCPFSHTQHRA